MRITGRKSSGPSARSPEGPAPSKPAHLAANAEDFRQIDPSAASLIPEGTEKWYVEPTVESSRRSRDRELELCFRLLAEGRLSALADIYDAVGRGLFGYIRTLVGSTDDAEDIFQEVFAKLAAAGAKLVRVARPHAYIFAMARNETWRFLKMKSRAGRTLQDDLLFEKAAPAAEKMSALSADEVAQALLTVPALQREVVVLKIYEGFTFAEIGRLTGVSQHTAASRYRYGLAKLAGKFKKYRGSVQ